MKFKKGTAGGYRTHKVSKISPAETPFNIHLNNHQSEVSDTNVILACRRFAQSNHDFNTDAKFTLIERIKNGNKPTEVVQDILRKHKNILDYWSDTLHHHGQNQELNP